MNGDVLEALVDLLIDEETLGVGFEIHRAIKLQYYDVVNPDPRYEVAWKAASNYKNILLFLPLSLAQLKDMVRITCMQLIYCTMPTYIHVCMQILWTSQDETCLVTTFSHCVNLSNVFVPHVREL